MSDPKLVNVATLAWQRCSRSDRITVEFKDPANHLGSKVSGFRIERLAPGKQASPVHRHHLQEEMFLILAGTGVLRHGNRDVPVRAGDFIVYPPGDPVPHTFVNDGSEPLEFIAAGNRVSHEVCEYPEDGTVYVEALDRVLRSEEVPGTREPFLGSRPETTSRVGGESSATQWLGGGRAAVGKAAAASKRDERHGVHDVSCVGRRPRE